MIAERQSKRPLFHPEPKAREIGLRIRRRLQQLDLSVAELARRTGCCYDTVYGWVHGMYVPNTRGLIRLARTLRMPSIDHLLFGAPRRRWARRWNRKTQED